MESKIKWVEEAYSHQPSTFICCIKEHEHNKDCVAKIEIETIQTETDKQINVYVGYDFENNKVFQLIQSSCNIGFFNPHPK